MTTGGRNLTILGFVAIAIALILTGISLSIYHYSGDIYLDRSRPGYLPDEEEVEDEEKTDESEYVFEKTGPVTDVVIEEYLEKLQIEVKALDTYGDPFGDGPLTDAELGIGSK